MLSSAMVIGVAGVPAGAAQARGLVTVTVVANGPGSVAAGAERTSPLICRKRCRLTLAAGDSVGLVARPARGAGFTGFNTGCKAAPICSLKVKRSVQVVARFRRAREVSLRVTGSGSVAAGGAKPCTGSCSLAGPGGHVRLLRATPGAGRVVAWKGCAAAAGVYCVARDGAKVAAAFAAAPAAAGARAAATVPVALTVNVTRLLPLGGVTGDIFAQDVNCSDSCHYALFAPSSSQFVLLASPDPTLPPHLIADLPSMFGAYNSCGALGGQEDVDASSDGEIVACFGPIGPKLTGLASIEAAFVKRPYLAVEIDGKGGVTEADARVNDESGQPIGADPIHCTVGRPDNVCGRPLNREGSWSGSQLHAKAAPGWYFDHWTGCLSQGAGPNRCLVPSGYGPARVTAVFSRQRTCDPFPRATSCITGLVYEGSESSIVKTAEPASTACAQGNWASRDIAWNDQITQTNRLYDGTGVRGDENLMTGAYSFDLDCGILHEHCTGKLLDTFPVLGTVKGTEGDWTVDIEAYDSSPHADGGNCPNIGPVGDATVRSTFNGTIHLRGTPGHPQPRTVQLTVTRNSSFHPENGVEITTSVHGHLTVSGVW